MSSVEHRRIRLDAEYLGLLPGEQHLFFYPVRRSRQALIALFDLNNPLTYISAYLQDKRGALAKIMRTLSSNRVDFLYGSDRLIVKNGLFRWEAIADLGELEERQARSLLESTGLLRFREKTVVRPYLDHLCERHHFTARDLDIAAVKTKKLDSRSRVSIPIEVAKQLGIDSAAQRWLVISVYDTESLTVFLAFAQVESLVTRVTMRIVDSIGSAAKIASHMASRDLDILCSDNRVVQRGVSSNWQLILSLENYLRRHRLVNSSREQIRMNLRKDVESRKPWVLGVKRIEYPLHARQRAIHLS